MFTQSLPPDIVLVHTSIPVDGIVSLGTEVDILPAAIEADMRVELNYDHATAGPCYIYGDAMLACDGVV